MSIKRVRLLVAFFVATASLVCGHSLLAQDSSTKADEPVYELHNARENGIQAPKGTYMPEAEYTDQARRKKISGVVLLSFVVAKDGTVHDAYVTKGVEESLDKQSLNTVSKWKFQPATRDGQPVAVRIQAEMSFRIR